MLNSLVQSLWKTCVRIFLYHNLGLHLGIIISFMYGFYHPYIFIVTLSFILIYRKRLHYLTLFILMVSMSLFFLINSEGLEDISGIVKVVGISEKTYQSQYRLRYKGKYVLIYEDKDTYNIGDIYHIKAKVIPFPKKTRPFGIDLSNFYKGYHTYGTLEIEEITFIKHTFHIQSLRHTWIEALGRFQSKDVFYAFIFDMTPDIDSDINWVYLMRMSGLHIFFIIEIMRFLFKKQFKHPIIPLVLSLVFFILQDFNPSMFRLSIYYALSLILYLFHVSIQRSLKIVITWFLQLLLMPYAIFNIGLMLSYLIVLCIHYIQTIFKKHHVLVRLYLSSISVQLILLPLTHVFVWTQVLISPILFGLIFYFLYPFMLLTLVMPILDPYLFQMYQILILSIERLDAWYVSIHVKDLTEVVLIILVIVFFYVLRSQTPYIFIKRVLFSLCFMGISLISFKDMGIYVYALDTGQGDSNIIFSKDCTIVIDAFQYVEETLLGLGVKSIDYVFITHNDIDHVKELNRLDRVFKIKHVISNPYTRLPVKNQMFVEIPYTLTCGDLNIHLLGPLKDYKNDNDNSLNIKVEMYDKKILFMGDSSKDVELDLMNQYDDFLEVDIIKIGHHGSNTSTHENFIDGIKADKAIISVGRNNRYGMPHLDVLKTLKKSQVQILRTDTMGTIEISIKRGYMKYRFYEP